MVKKCAYILLIALLCACESEVEQQGLQLAIVDHGWNVAETRAANLPSDTVGLPIKIGAFVATPTDEYVNGCFKKYTTHNGFYDYAMWDDVNDEWAVNYIRPTGHTEAYIYAPYHNTNVSMTAADDGPVYAGKDIKMLRWEDVPYICDEDMMVAYKKYSGTQVNEHIPFYMQHLLARVRFFFQLGEDMSTHRTLEILRVTLSMKVPNANYTFEVTPAAYVWADRYNQTEKAVVTSSTTATDLSLIEHYVEMEDYDYLYRPVSPANRVDAGGAIISDKPGLWLTRTGNDNQYYHGNFDGSFVSVHDDKLGQPNEYYYQPWGSVYLVPERNWNTGINDYAMPATANAVHFTVSVVYNAHNLDNGKTRKASADMAEITIPASKFGVGKCCNVLINIEPAYLYVMSELD